ncbi:hypothetical protein OIU78_014638 [Salix suchowensis]|nr:hypothetical protein OIU78_014638 [Salix suchowensis]
MLLGSCRVVHAGSSSVLHVSSSDVSVDSLFNTRAWILNQVLDLVLFATVIYDNSFKWVSVDSSEYLLGCDFNSLTEQASDVSIFTFPPHSRGATLLA